MKKQNPFEKWSGIALKILITLSAIIYTLIFVEEATPPFYESVFGVAMVYVLFFFFLTGYYFLWKNEKISGIILILWYGFLLIVGVLVWTGAGTVLVIGFPISVLGALLLFKAYFKNIKGLVLK